MFLFLNTRAANMRKPPGGGGEIRLRSKDKQLRVIIINAIKFPSRPTLI